MYILRDVFLFVITLPDCFSICIVWITLYVFEKGIVLPMVVCHAHGRVSKSLNIYPKRHCNRCVAGIFNILNSQKYICVPLFVALTMCFLCFLIYGHRKTICLS